MTAKIRYALYSVLTVVTVGSDYAVSTDERNAPAAEPSGSPNAEGMSRDSGRKRVRKVTIRRIDILGDCVETGEAVFTNGVEVVKTKSRSYFGGGMSTRREWGGDKFTEERRFENYATDGCRIDYVVTESSDCGVVTNSVSTYDLLGRLIAVETPCAGLGGSQSLATAITSNTYDGTSSRKLSSTHTAGDIVRTIAYLYNEFGEQCTTFFFTVKKTAMEQPVFEN